MSTRMTPANALLATALTLVVLHNTAHAASPAPQTASLVQRGAYLVNFAGCADCHTPLKMGPRGPEPDLSRTLSGHPESMSMPPAPKTEGPWNWSGAATLTAFAGPWGVSYASNLTPDKDTGIGLWRLEDFVDAMRTGKHMGAGRPILPPMPWQGVGKLSDEDLRALYSYLMSVPPVKNRVPVAELAHPAP